MRFLRENGLALFFGTIFLLALGGQSVAGQRSFNAEQLEHGEEPVSWLRYLFTSDFGQAVTENWQSEQAAHGEPAVSWAGYVTNARFWEETLQNWQSEFLAVGVMVVFTIYLRQRGSPESKPVGAQHDETGSSG